MFVVGDKVEDINQREYVPTMIFRVNDISNLIGDLSTRDFCCIRDFNLFFIQVEADNLSFG